MQYNNNSLVRSSQALSRTNKNFCSWFHFSLCLGTWTGYKLTKHPLSQITTTRSILWPCCKRLVKTFFFAISIDFKNRMNLRQWQGILFNTEDDFMLAQSNFSSKQQKSRTVYSYCIRGSRFSQSPSQFFQCMEKYVTRPGPASTRAEIGLLSTKVDDVLVLLLTDLETLAGQHNDEVRTRVKEANEIRRRWEQTFFPIPRIAKSCWNWVLIKMLKKILDG